MPQLKSPLEASSYLHPDPERHGPFTDLRKTTIEAMVERGIEYATLAEHPIAWAEDQDPFGHVMAQAYPHIIAKCFVRLLESFHEHLQDKFEDFMAARGISAMTNRLNGASTQVAKYPDLLISGVRIIDVRDDMFSAVFSVWSVVRNEQIHEAQARIVFFDHSRGEKANLAQEGGVYSDLHASLVSRAAKSAWLFETWKEKENSKAAGGKRSKL